MTVAVVDLDAAVLVEAGTQHRMCQKMKQIYAILPSNSNISIVKPHHSYSTEFRFYEKMSILLCF